MVKPVDVLVYNQGYSEIMVRGGLHQIPSFGLLSCIKGTFLAVTYV